MTNWVVQIVLQELCLYMLENSGSLCSLPSPVIIKEKKKNLWVLVSCLGKYWWSQSYDQYQKKKKFHAKNSNHFRLKLYRIVPFSPHLWTNDLFKLEWIFKFTGYIPKFTSNHPNTLKLHFSLSHNGWTHIRIPCRQEEHVTINQTWVVRINKYKELKQ